MSLWSESQCETSPGQIQTREPQLGLHRNKAREPDRAHPGETVLDGAVEVAFNLLSVAANPSTGLAATVMAGL